MSAPILVVALTVVLDLVGFGIVIPLLTFYAESFHASPQQVTWLMASYSLAQFVAAPLWGQLSDRVGRRPVLVASIGLTALMLAGFASANALWMLFLFRILHGVMTANIAIAQACIADLTTPENRARGMGLLGAAFGVGFTIGPFIGGELSTFGLSVPIWTAAALSGINFLLALWLLPETRRPDSRVHHRPISPVALVQALRDPRSGLLIGLVFLQVGSFAMMESTFTLFAEHERGVRAQDVGRLFGVVGLVAIVVQGGLIGRLVRRWGERPLVPLGLAITAIGIALLPLAPTGPAMYATFATVALGQGVLNPSIQSLISRGADAHEQGRVLGASQSFSALGRAVGPAFGGVLFAQVAPAAPFYLAAAALLLGVILAIPATRRTAYAGATIAET